LYATTGAAETACAAVDSEVRFHCDCDGQEDGGVFVGLTVAEASVQEHVCWVVRGAETEAMEMVVGFEVVVYCLMSATIRWKSSLFAYMYIAKDA